MGEEIFVKLRFSFQAGYTLPQYCIDTGIKKPLFVLDRVSELFLKEIYAQFYYDARLTAQFCFIDSEKESVIVWLNGFLLNQYTMVKNISAVNINVFDKIIFLTKKNFDIYTKNIIRFEPFERDFLRRGYLEIPLLHFLQRYPKTKFFQVQFLEGPKRYEGGADFATKLLGAGDLRKTLLANKNGHIETPFDKFGYTNAEVIELLKEPATKKNPDGTTVLKDDNHPFQQIRNGKRVTAYQPENYWNKIYFVGPCYYFGLYSPFDKTIESYLQKMLNENNFPYRVENEGQLFFNRYRDMFFNLNALNPAPDDIIFFHVWHLDFKSDVLPFFDLRDAFDPPHDYRELFCTKPAHVNETGYKILAEKFFDFLTANNFFRDKEFKYPPLFLLLTSIATVYRHNTNGAARLSSKMRSWRLTSRLFAKKKFQSAQSS